MPQTKKQGLIFALITVIITVPCFVFYCSSYEAGGFNVDVIKSSLIFIPIEFIMAYLCEIFIGSPIRFCRSKIIANFREIRAGNC